MNSSNIHLASMIWPSINSPAFVTILRMFPDALNWMEVINLTLRSLRRKLVFKMTLMMSSKVNKYLKNTKFNLNNLKKLHPLRLQIPLYIINQHHLHWIQLVHVLAVILMATTSSILTIVQPSSAVFGEN
jgi:hypothetical protein